MGFFDKEPSSRVLSNQYLQLTAATTTPIISSAFGAQTKQIRVLGQMPIWVNIGDSVATALTSASMFIPSSTAAGEYFVVTPGQTLALCSTSGTSGCINIAEMT